MKFCNQCKKEISMNQNYCVFCGSKLAEKNNKNKFITLSIVSIVLFSIVNVINAIYLFLVYTSINYLFLFFSLMLGCFLLFTNIIIFVILIILFFKNKEYSKKRKRLLLINVFLFILTIITSIFLINLLYDDDNYIIINDEDVSLENSSDCYYRIESGFDNVGVFGTPDGIYHVNFDIVNIKDLELSCEKKVVNINDIIKMIFIRKDIEFNGDNYENYNVDIYINDKLINTDYFKNNEVEHSIQSNTFRVYEINNLYFFTNYIASQCGGADTLIVDKNGNVLKTIRNFTYTFNDDSTFTVHDYGNCFDINDDKEIVYKVENNMIVEIR